MVQGLNPGGDKIFHTHPDQSWCPPSLLLNGYRVFPRGKVVRAWHWSCTPCSTEVKERVPPNLYSHTEPANTWGTHCLSPQCPFPLHTWGQINKVFECKKKKKSVVTSMRHKFLPKKQSESHAYVIFSHTPVHDLWFLHSSWCDTTAKRQITSYYTG